MRTRSEKNPQVYIDYTSVAKALYICKRLRLLQDMNPDPTAQNSALLTTIPMDGPITSTPHQREDFELRAVHQPLYTVSLQRIRTRTSNSITPTTNSYP
ncbi:hypothetical protein TNCV_2069281 [Trichonephila clavipes]|uniref:Uncharacterized protein n=1 Tax=Trichonephila clavipes TaxID=2585209 RepID=A0A8X6W2W8_TRICX|nr:hypothetical protein TNCV_2069281 [Trichonephila clavipes]